MKNTYIKDVMLIGVALSALGVMANAADWHVPGSFATIQEAIDNAAVDDGDRILVGSGEHAGALVDKSVEIKGTGGATISSGPVHPSGFFQGFRLLAGSGGATISHLIFTVDFPVMNGDGVNNVTVSHCELVTALQGISNWRGSGWDISHNQITNLRTACGGGIAILVGDFSGGTVQDNIVAHNVISGTLLVSDGDCGGYNGTGIVLFADFRGTRTGADSISFNRVVKNKISLVSDTPGVVDVAAIELTDTRDDSSLAVIVDNAIGFNDLRGTTLQIALTPENLDDVNDISRNLGDNRGHGQHPSVFGPGGN